MALFFSRWKVHRMCYRPRCRSRSLVLGTIIHRYHTGISYFGENRFYLGFNPSLQTLTNPADWNATTFCRTSPKKNGGGSYPFLKLTREFIETLKLKSVPHSSKSVFETIHRFSVFFLILKIKQASKLRTVLSTWVDRKLAIGNPYNCYAPLSEIKLEERCASSCTTKSDLIDESYK